MKKLLLELESQAFSAYKAKNFTLAISLYKKMIKLQSDFEHGGIWFQLANCYEELGQVKLAKESYEQSLLQDPDDYIKLCAYGSFLFQMSDYQSASIIYNKIYNYEIINNMDADCPLMAINALEKIVV